MRFDSAEPAPPRYDWENYDNMVALNLLVGLSLLVVIIWVIIRSRK